MVPRRTAPRIKKKLCVLCKDKMKWVDYKDVNLMRKYMSDRGKIRARRVSGNCAQHQNEVAVAIKTAASSCSRGPHVDRARWRA